jgi:hypothetical protein
MCFELKKKKKKKKNGNQLQLKTTKFIGSDLFQLKRRVFISNKMKSIYLIVKI